MKDSKDSKLLKEIRENYTYFTDAWRPIRDEARTDMRYVAGDPWDQKDKQFRKNHDRPCMSWDELSPYINQLVNDPRQNKRAIKVNPKGAGADDKTAQLREDTFRDIQYNSRAQAALTTAFQGAAERSYGWFGIGSRLVAQNLTEEQIDEIASETPEKLFEQELFIYRIPNPDSVTPNPTYCEQDASDMTECFVEKTISRAQFKRDWPNAKYLDWQSDFATEADGWQHEKEVRVAEYWKVIVRKRKLNLYSAGKSEPISFYEDKTPEEYKRKKISHSRTVETRCVKQWITNGLEILEESDEIPIPWIPIVPVFGKEIWVDRGSGAKRELISLVRMARDPMMFYCYLRSQEAEEFGMAPRSPLIGYTGQFETDREKFINLNKEPTAFVQIDPVPDPLNPTQVLPLPTRIQFQPNAQGYELAAEAARRAIRTAMGGSDLPLAAQRNNEKSGVALKQIEASEDRGTFHFIDNYNFSLEHAGRIMNAWYPFVYDTPRDIAIREANETHRTVRINDPKNTEKGPNGEVIQAHYDAITGDHGVTVSVGKDYASQRDEASEFVQGLLPEIQAIAAMLPPGAGAKLLALAIRLQNMGPLGDKMADTIDPPADEKEQQAKMGQLQGAAQQQQQVIGELQAELQKMRLEKAGKVIDNQFKAEIEQMKTASQEKLAQLQNDIKVLIAEVQAKSQSEQERNRMFLEFWQENHGAAHEAAMQATEHAHEKDQAAAAAQNAATSQAADQAHESTMAAQSSQGEGVTSQGDETQ